MLKNKDFTTTCHSLWQTLKEQAQHAKNYNIKNLFEQDENRVKNFSLQVGDIYFDYSKNIITDENLKCLLELAEKQGIIIEIENLFTGQKINHTEQRAALHTALRMQGEESLHVDGVDVRKNIRDQKVKMSQIVEKLRDQKWLGVRGQPITDVVNIGIGGSDLGPKMALEALEYYMDAPFNLHFISNIDPLALHLLLNKLNPSTTLFIVSSKSFTTIETLTNAKAAKTWLSDGLETKNVSQHFIAVTTQPDKAQAFGVSEQNILSFEDWVGGRYSVWSTIGLPLALGIGMAQFEAFLAGAHSMDKHFRQAPFEKNMPVLLALIGIWYIQGWQANNLAVLPYAQGLRSLPDYLQQLDMESNGKQVQRSGESVSYATGPIVWGQAGTNGQHAFYQLLHQGTHFIPIDFIVATKCEDARFSESHQKFVANCFAQAQALMLGCSSQNAYETMPGNRPSNMLLLSKMTPNVLGQLLALYEHKVFVQAMIWNINPFDQPGVELGKKLAIKIEEQLQSGDISEASDHSTKVLIEKVRKA